LTAPTILECLKPGLVPNNGLEIESPLNKLNKVANISDCYVADSSGMQIAKLTKQSEQYEDLNNE